MPTPPFLDRIAAAHGCSPDVARAIMTDCLAVLHETSYKHGTPHGVAAAHAELGGLAAWHLMGLVVDAAETASPGALVEAYMKVEPAPSQYDAIWAQWDDHKAGR
jgi:hypothetical protein